LDGIGLSSDRFTVSVAERFDTITSLKEDRKGSGRDESHIAIEPEKWEDSGQSKRKREKEKKRRDIPETGTGKNEDSLFFMEQLNEGLV